MAKHQFWLVKQEPEAYPWSALVADGKTVWTGVRNYQARNNLRVMKKGDAVLYYHSGGEKQIVGLAKVAAEARPDPTATEGDWSCVDLAAVKSLQNTVTLAAIKADPLLKTMVLARNSRLSVSPVTESEFLRLLALGSL